MKKEFLPYNESLALKDLGFDEPCFKGYTEEYKNLINFSNTHTNTSIQKTLPTKPFTAPLYQQAFRWFREKHNLQLGICHINNGFDCWTNDGDLLENGKFCDINTYEEAELVCLRKLIEIVKNKQNE